MPPVLPVEANKALTVTRLGCGGPDATAGYR
jgi:hypothetical protein